MTAREDGGGLRGKDRIPICVHPSEHIRDELEARGWSLDELAMRMDADNFGIERLALDFYFEVGPTEPDLRLGDSSARLMAAAFDVSADYFLNLEASWLRWIESPAGRRALAAAGDGR